MNDFGEGQENRTLSQNGGSHTEPSTSSVIGIWIPFIWEYGAMLNLSLNLVILSSFLLCRQKSLVNFAASQVLVPVSVC